ncbi:MAG: HIT family protein [Paludibacter sp.]|jgi:histidine triad (HIT) family protein|nr:HIT family protein [Paludibacter sp.]
MATIFSKIAAGEIPSYKIAEDNKYFAFLDINPMRKGHTLVIPKRENDYVFDLTDTELSELVVFAKKIALAIKKATNCKRVGMLTVGLEVPHTHIHLVPFDNESQMNIANPKLKLSDDEMSEIAQAIRQML